MGDARGGWMVDASGNGGCGRRPLVRGTRAEASVAARGASPMGRSGSSWRRRWSRRPSAGAGLLLGVLEGVGGRGSLDRAGFLAGRWSVCMENIQRGADAACYLDRLKRLSDGLSLANLRRVDVLGAFVEGQVAGVLGLLSRQMDAYPGGRWAMWWRSCPG